MSAQVEGAPLEREELQREMEMYRQMLLIRRFEERALELRAGREVAGPVHPYIGQEAIAVGVCAALGRQDRITSTHRGHGHCIAKGAEPRRMFAELLGRSSGYCQGRAGSMHMADFSVGMLGANGIVAAGMPIAAGAALVSSFERDGSVAVSFFGDGAVSAGPFHESLNLSSLWKLPVIWVCEDNGWAVATSRRTALAARSVTDIGEALGIPSYRVDGNDARAVYAAAKPAVDRARVGCGPTLIEATTYRMLSHVFKDGPGPDNRDPAELIRWKERDPIDLMRLHLTGSGALDRTIDAQVRDGVCEAIEAAIEYARSSSESPLESALSRAFSDEVV